jgi:hypothetical protein
MSSPFDHQPDHELGAALRAALDAGDNHAFVQRVTAAGGSQLAEPSGVWWGVLGPWARPGMAAALALIAAMGFWLGNRSLRGGVPAELDDPIQAAGGLLEVPALLAGQTAPDMDVVLGVALGR